ncbi:MAG: hypothetical protein HGA36_01210 [Candidatus Moranbacteria bacterium]|nr:hypothetical protein [Candidatus Moranbacteria bacterium]
MKKPRKNKKKILLKKIRRLHAIVSMVLFFSYVILSVSYSPEFLFSDIKSKFSALADEAVTITAKVLAPPIKPIVSITGTCNTGEFNINLTWPSDENSTFFDIYRNGFPLVTGTAFNSYLDTNTTINTTYSYVVTAHGPMGNGFADSDSVTITSPQLCGSNSETPTITLAPLSPNDGFYTILDTTRPRFSGTTNIPYGIINLQIHSTQIIYGDTLANLNGYWSWDPPLDITNGVHTLFVTVQDPLDSSRTVSGELYFIIDFKAASTSTDDNDNNNKHAQSKEKATTQLPSTPTKNHTTPAVIPEEKPELKPVTYSLELKNDSLVQGKNLDTIVSIQELDSKYDGRVAALAYQVLDAKGNSILTNEDSITLAAGENIAKTVMLPAYLKDGTYKLKTSLKFDTFIIEQERIFHVTPKPFLNLGGSIFMTYPEFLSALGLIASISLLLLLLWLFLFSREYWLSLHALRQITEENLASLGLISLKKRKY